MASHEDFLQAISENAEDDALRLIYADWLEEHGESPRAEFIRLQCELARGVEEPRRQSLAQRQQELWDQHEPAWRAALPKLPGIKWGRWERGFVCEVSAAGASSFCNHAHRLLAAAPIRRLSFGARLTRRTAAHVARCPELARIDTLHLFNAAIGPDGVRALAGSSHVAQLTTLCLLRGKIGAAGARALAASPHLRRLRSLQLRGNDISPDGALALAASPVLDEVRTLDLGQNQLGAPGARALAESQHLSNLRELYLGSNAIGPLGARALAESPFLPELRELSLVDNAIGDAGIQAFAGSPHRGRLAALHLAGNRVGTAGALALAASRGLTSLVRITVYDYPHRIAANAVAALRERFGDQVELM